MVQSIRGKPRTGWGGFCCYPALSSELGLMLLTAQVARGSVGSPNGMVGDRLELDACDLELVCTLYLVPSTFEVSAQSTEYGSLFASARSESSIRLNWKRPSDIRSLRSVDNWTGSGN